MLDAPHPRILFQDVPDQLLLERLGSLAGTWDVVSDSAAEVHASDWDLVVSFSQRPFVMEPMHLLSFGATTYKPHLVSGRLVVPGRTQILHARSVRVAVDDEIAGLLQRSVVANDPGPGLRKRLASMPPGSIPLVTVGDEKEPWAGLLSYRTGLTVYALPAETTHHVEWLAAVLKRLHLVSPDRFPAEPDWREGPDWATPGLLAAHEELLAVETERQAALAAFDSREDTARSALATQAAAAAAGMQRLLTASGDDLVEAVKEVLIKFGFTAEEMDTHHDATNGAKLEDLRVTWTDSRGKTWTALVEVKGYSKGAKANDVGQIFGRPAIAYLKDVGREADGLWHIVNVWREQNPSVRGEPFTGASDLFLLAENGGCAVDTRDLFRAWRDLERGSVSAVEVRDSLISAQGRWAWPAT